MLSFLFLTQKIMSNKGEAMGGGSGDGSKIEPHQLGFQIKWPVVSAETRGLMSKLASVDTTSISAPNLVVTTIDVETRTKPKPTAIETPNGMALRAEVKDVYTN
jgi:hypothetical protein